MYYRKYRPQTVAELDNERIRETLGRALLSDNFVHAYLLTGSRGTGKTSTARLIAKIVNCTNRKKGEEPCNKCDSCKAITEGRSLDVIEIDAASNTGVDDIRDLRDKARLAPSSSRFKVYIIDEVHMLSNSAFNALLKILEEPPPQVIFVLATTEVTKLPETIISRCLVYNFAMATKKDLIHSLKKAAAGEKLAVSDEILDQIAELAGGSYRDGQKILEQLAASGKKITAEEVMKLNLARFQNYARKILDLMAERKAGQAIKVVEEYTAFGGKGKDLMTEILLVLQNALLFQHGLGEKGTASDWPETEIMKLTDKILAAYPLLRDSPLGQLPLELVVAEYCQEKATDNAKIGKVSPDNKENDSFNVVLKPDNPSKSNAPLSDLMTKWLEVLAAVKPYNHSLVALLRACRPIEIKGNNFVIGVFYKFHKDKLSENRNREILEKILSGIFGTDIKVKFVLSEGKR